MSGRAKAVLWAMLAGAALMMILARVFVTNDANFDTYMTLLFVPLWIVLALNAED